MDEEKRIVNYKKSTKRHYDEGEKKKISFNLRSSSSSSNKQPAQERLKRLQTNLKYENNKKNEKERISPQKKSRRISNTASAHASTAPPLPHHHFQRRRSATPPKQTRSCEEKSPKYYRSPEKTRTASHFEPASIASSSSSSSSGRYSGRSSSSAHHKLQPGSSHHVELRNAWAKPKALLDASNRLEAGSRTISANQRLALLRESLQQQQLNPTSSSDNNNNDSPWSSRKLQPAVRGTKTSSNCYDDDEPMDMDTDWQKPEDAAHRTTSSKLLLPAKPAAPAESMEEDLSDITLLRLLSTGQDLPARLEDYMYFVLDTNVLLDNLVFVEELSQLALHNTSGSMLYIPYVVFRELDSLKDRRQDDELKRAAAVRAIRYLSNKFDNSLSIQAQSAKEEVEHLIDVECADDSIVNCCLQLQSQVPHLMLLTNDNVLRIKAKSSYIEVSCRSDLMRDFREQFDALPL